MASDEVDYNQEVIFSPYLIGYENGKKLPINLNLNSPLTTQNLELYYGTYNPQNVIVSENFYDPEKPEEYVHDPELIDYDVFFKDLWEKEDNFLKSVGVEPPSGTI